MMFKMRLFPWPEGFVQERVFHVLYQGGLLLQLEFDLIQRLDEGTNSLKAFIVLGGNWNLELPKNRRVNMLDD